MVEGTFGSDGELKKTGPSGVKTAEGLGGSNIQGVDDAKVKQDANAETGKDVPKEHINSSNQYPRVGTDPGSKTLTSTMHVHACMLSDQVTSEFVSHGWRVVQPTQ